MNLPLRTNGNGRVTPTFAGDRQNRLSDQAEPWQSSGGFGSMTFSSQIPSGYWEGVPTGFGLLRGVGRTAERQPSPLFGNLSVSAQSATRLPSGIVDGFAKVCDRWRVGEHDAATLLGLTDNVALARSILNGDLLPFTRDIRDRITHIIGISFGLGEIFNDDVE